jgi:hypothetical protein
MGAVKPPLADDVSGMTESIELYPRVDSNRGGASTVTEVGMSSSDGSATVTDCPEVPENSKA